MDQLKIAVDQNIFLSTLIISEADVLFDLVNTNRTHLREWLPWVDNNKTAEDSRKFIEKSQEKLSKNNGFDLGIYFNEKLVGIIGINHFDALNQKVEIGYWLSKNHQGKGIMTKSVKTLIKYIFQTLKMHRIQIDVALGNKKSTTIPDRLGFKKEGIQHQAGFLYDHFVDLQTYALLKDEFPEDS